VILVTGFQPFVTPDGEKLDHNPTADIAHAVAEGRDDVFSAVLPVSFVGTRKALVYLLQSYRPSAWIGLGYAANRKRIEQELVGLNVEHAERPDNDGETPNSRAILKRGPLAYRCDPLPIGAARSFHAGTFLCNQVLYLCLHARATTGHPKTVGFFHVPPDAEAECIQIMRRLVDLLTED